MKKLFRSVMTGILAALLCAALSGCTVGKYHFFDAHTDENGGRHFMLLGETGPSGN